MTHCSAGTKADVTAAKSLMEEDIAWPTQRNQGMRNKGKEKMADYMKFRVKMSLFCKGCCMMS